MDAQQIISESETTDFKEMFYPPTEQEKADKNITKCLRELRE